MPARAGSPGRQGAAPGRSVSGAARRARGPRHAGRARRVQQDDRRPRGRRRGVAELLDDGVVELDRGAEHHACRLCVLHRPASYAECDVFEVVDAGEDGVLDHRALLGGREALVEHAACRSGDDVEESSRTSPSTSSRSWASVSSACRSISATSSRVRPGYAPSRALPRAGAFENRARARAGCLADASTVRAPRRPASRARQRAPARRGYATAASSALGMMPRYLPKPKATALMMKTRIANCTSSMTRCMGSWLIVCQSSSSIAAIIASPTSLDGPREDAVHGGVHDVGIDVADDLLARKAHALDRLGPHARDLALLLLLDVRAPSRSCASVCLRASVIACGLLGLRLLACDLDERLGLLGGLVRESCGLPRPGRSSLGPPGIPPPRPRSARGAPP